MGLNASVVAKYSDYVAIEGYISETVQDRGKLVLITNRKSRISLRFVPNSMTLNDLERRNNPEVAFGADYVKMVEDTSVLSAAEM